LFTEFSLTVAAAVVVSYGELQPEDRQATAAKHRKRVIADIILRR